MGVIKTTKEPNLLYAPKIYGSEENAFPIVNENYITFFSDLRDTNIDAVHDGFCDFAKFIEDNFGIEEIGIVLSQQQYRETPAKNIVISTEVYNENYRNGYMR